MQIEEMLKEFDFHDSSLIELVRENDEVRLKIDLCMWRQKGYKEGEEECKEVVLVFDSVTEYVWTSDKSENKIDYETIMKASYNRGVMEIVLHSDVVSIIIFKGVEVSIQE